MTFSGSGSINGSMGCPIVIWDHFTPQTNCSRVCLDLNSDFSSNRSQTVQRKEMNPRLIAWKHRKNVLCIEFDTAEASGRTDAKTLCFEKVVISQSSVLCGHLLCNKLKQTLLWWCESSLVCERPNPKRRTLLIGAVFLDSPWGTAGSVPRSCAALLRSARFPRVRSLIRRGH